MGYTSKFDSFELVSPGSLNASPGVPKSSMSAQTNPQEGLPADKKPGVAQKVAPPPGGLQKDLSAVLMNIYTELLDEDPQVKAEALKAFHEIKSLPPSEKDEKASDPGETGGMVNRRAPLNPLASPRLGKFRQRKKVQKGKKVFDPALKNNPLRGRLVMLLTSSAVLFFIFWQSLCFNKTEFQAFHAPWSHNSLLGPEPDTLLRLGGLNVDKIRNEGETFRLFWAMWMHAGWIHISLNVISQLQYLFMFEPDWGLFRVMSIYWFSGISGNLLSAVCNPCATTVGSSGALFGLMGAMIPYCLEFWNTIPRPAFLLCFSVLVLVISLVTGFTSQTDNWAHMGGLLGGLFSSLATVPTSAICAPLCSRMSEAAGGKGTKKQLGSAAVAKPKKVVRRGRLARLCQRRWFPRYRCGRREWLIRGIALASLCALWTLGFVMIFSSYEYTPPGQLTFSGVIKCSCCREFGSDKWSCKRDKEDYRDTQWGTYCQRSFASKGLKAIAPKYQPETRLAAVPSTLQLRVPGSAGSGSARRRSEGVSDGASPEQPANWAKALKQVESLVVRSNYEDPQRDNIPVNFSAVFKDPLTNADVQWLEAQRERSRIRHKIARRFLDVLFQESASLFGTQLEQRNDFPFLEQSHVGNRKPLDSNNKHRHATNDGAIGISNPSSSSVTLRYLHPLVLDAVQNLLLPAPLTDDTWFL